MKKIITFIAAAALMSLSAAAQDSAPKKVEIKPYGFIRTYFVADTRESLYGTEDFFYYLPKDVNMSGNDDMNNVNSFSYGAITSRLGFNVTGYEIDGWNLAAKIEADFYAGVSGVTGTALFRLRQAFMTLDKGASSIKIGQAWHPMAADMPDVFALNTGAPFGPFSRTPLISYDYKTNSGFSLTLAAIWQMQYTSAGPEGASANYMKYSGIPEGYLGLNYKTGGFLFRVGADVLSIKPRRFDSETKRTKRVSDRITTVTPFLYLQYAKDAFTVKAKTTYAQAGEHLSLNGGYGVSAFNSDGSWEYTPTTNSSTWVSLSYGKKFQGVLFAGYVKNFGAAKPIVGDIYFSKNSYANMTDMWRIAPEFMFNMGKFTVGAEWEVTSVRYGDFPLLNNCGLATENLHWVTNNRFQVMARYTF